MAGAEVSGRDHSIECVKCGTWYGGLNDPWQSHVCGGSAVVNLPPRTDSVRIYPGPQCEHTERIAALEALIEFYSSNEQKHRDDTFASIARLDAVERRLAELESTALAAQSVGLIRDRRTDNRRTASDVPVPSRRGKGRRK